MEKGTQMFSVAVHAPLFCIGKKGSLLDKLRTTQGGKPPFSARRTPPTAPGAEDAHKVVYCSVDPDCLLSFGANSFNGSKPFFSASAARSIAKRRSTELGCEERKPQAARWHIMRTFFFFGLTGKFCR